MSIRVLLAEPDRLVLQACREYLTQREFEVETADDGPNCVDKLNTWQPDVLVLEPDMTNGWGDTVLNELRKHATTRDVPVLVLSRRDRQELAYPVVEYFVKPISLAKLAEAIRSAAHHHDDFKLQTPPSRN